MSTHDPSLALAPRILDRTIGELSGAVPAARRNLFIFGLGYTGQYIGRALIAAGWRVGGTSRDRETRASLTKQGFEARDFDPATGLDFNNILTTIGPNRSDGSDPVLAAFGASLIARQPDWFGYFSATSVYGDGDNGKDGAEDWIDSRTPAKPGTARGKRRLASEQAWRELLTPARIPVSLFRIAGIYGPDRNILEQLQAGTARSVDKPGHVFNRIHVQDIARAVTLRIAEPQALTIDNLADGNPMSQPDWVARAAAQLGITPPVPVPFDQAYDDMSPMGRSFWSESKRIKAPDFK